jgi:hypothetical protein
MKHGIPRKRVGVVGDPSGGSYGLLFSALAQLHPVEFSNCATAQPDGLDAVIILDGDTAAGLAVAAAVVPAFVMMGGSGTPTQASVRQVRFGASVNLDSCLRNQKMVLRQETSFSPLATQPGDEVLASVEDRPVWLARGACQLFGALPPRLQQDEFLFQHLNSRRFMELLPLVHFLRQLVKATDWAGPPPRACLVFDDPSFYWRSYGFVNFRRLGEHATRHNYFAAVATIPIDTWGVNRGVATTLRSFSPRLSILIHGNNHLNREMLLRNREEGLATAAQALRRMERLARQHELQFARIMEAPHAVLSNNMLQQLREAGFDAALCTTELFVRHNPDLGLPAGFGLDRSEMLGGLPTLPRIKLTPDWKNDVLLAAFLRQPIIIAGHHYDAAHGMKLMAEMAEAINQLDGVTWSDLPGILRTNYLQRTDGDVLIVKMYSKRITVTIPAGIRQLCVQRTWLAEGQTEKLIFSEGTGTKVERGAGSSTEWFTLTGSQTVEVGTQNEPAPSLVRISPPRLSPWVIARKILMEVRDRVTPLLPIVDRLHRGSAAQ